MAYAAKAASAFYGPFREAAGSAPAFGDRRGYQKDPANGREALREMSSMSRKGRTSCWSSRRLQCLDLIAAARARFDLPIAAYQVSGEYAMLAAAAERGWIDGRRRCSRRSPRSCAPAPASSSPMPPRTSPPGSREERGSRMR